MVSTQVGAAEQSRWIVIVQVIAKASSEIQSTSEHWPLLQLMPDAGITPCYRLKCCI